jgi:hypothetical protein
VKDKWNFKNIIIILGGQMRISEGWKKLEFLLVERTMNSD